MINQIFFKEKDAWRLKKKDNQHIQQAAKGNLLVIKNVYIPFKKQKKNLEVITTVKW